MEPLEGVHINKRDNCVLLGVLLLDFDLHADLARWSADALLPDINVHVLADDDSLNLRGLLGDSADLPDARRGSLLEGDALGLLSEIDGLNVLHYRREEWASPPRPLRMLFEVAL